VALAGRLGLPVVATHPVQFLEPDDFKAHEARVCIAHGYVLADQRRPKLYTPEQYFKTQAEMAELFADIPQALENSVEIARRCNLEIELGKSRLPAFPTPAGVSIDDYLRTEAHAGLARRFDKLAVKEQERSRYRERLEFELGTIIQMGFAGYFLIVADFIAFARREGIQTTCRGSAPGSIVTYSLGITPVDPLEYGLPFERFLNPDRVTMPDIDIDFQDSRRDEVIEYVTRKYGDDRVAQIITFGTLGAKAAIRRAALLPGSVVPDEGLAIAGIFGDASKLADSVLRYPATRS
jgi:DNA polymerase-3 subunit alpha